MDDVECTGNEFDILNCPFGSNGLNNEWGLHNCDITEAAGVSCMQDEPPPPACKIILIMLILLIKLISQIRLITLIVRIILIILIIGILIIFLGNFVPACKTIYN